MPYFHFEPNIFGIPDWKQLIVKPYICLPQRLTRHVNELTTVLYDTEYLSTNGLFGTIIGVAASYVFS